MSANKDTSITTKPKGSLENNPKEKKKKSTKKKDSFKISSKCNQNKSSIKKIVNEILFLNRLKSGMAENSFLQNSISPMEDINTNTYKNFNGDNSSLSSNNQLQFNPNQHLFSMTSNLQTLNSNFIKHTNTSNNNDNTNNSNLSINPQNINLSNINLVPNSQNNTINQGSKNVILISPKKSIIASSSKNDYMSKKPSIQGGLSLDLIKDELHFNEKAGNLMNGENPHFLKLKSELQMIGKRRKSIAIVNQISSKLAEVNNNIQPKGNSSKGLYEVLEPGERKTMCKNSPTNKQTTTRPKIEPDLKEGENYNNDNTNPIENNLKENNDINKNNDNNDIDGVHPSEPINNDCTRIVNNFIESNDIIANNLTNLNFNINDVNNLNANNNNPKNSSTVILSPDRKILIEEGDNNNIMDSSAKKDNPRISINVYNYGTNVNQNYYIIGNDDESTKRIDSIILKNAVNPNMNSANTVNSNNEKEISKNNNVNSNSNLPSNSLKNTIGQTSPILQNRLETKRSPKHNQSNDTIIEEKEEFITEMPHENQEFRLDMSHPVNRKSSNNIYTKNNTSLLNNNCRPSSKPPSIKQYTNQTFTSNSNDAGCLRGRRKSITYISNKPTEMEKKFHELVSKDNIALDNDHIRRTQIETNLRNALGNIDEEKERKIMNKGIKKIDRLYYLMKTLKGKKKL